MKIRKLFYMGLESYQARYTLQLTEWSRRVFNRRNIEVVYVPGQTLDNSQQISVGQVLDAHGRSYFSMSQMMNLVQMMQKGDVTKDDVIFFEDMYTTGFDALGYIMDQVSEEYRPRVYVRCLAQSIDPDDFLHVWGMTDWMRHYEASANEIVRKSKGAVLATDEEMVAHMRVAGWTAPIYNISGLSFGKEEVRERIGGPANIKPFDQRSYRVVFGARWDQEKNPDFFMDLIEKYNEIGSKKVEFALLSGGKLKSNNNSYLNRTKELQERGLLKVHQNLTKNEYYAILNDSRVLFNCALQDWVSNTVSEADALGCNVLYPAYRSFPETFSNDPTRMYVPWSLGDAMCKLEELLNAPSPNMGKISDWTDGTIDRYIDIMEGNGEQWLRMDRNYRRHTIESKY